MNMRTGILLVCVFLVFQPAASAQEEKRQDSSDNSLVSQQTTEPHSGSEQILPSLQLPWTEPTGTGFGIGYDNGFWGGNWVQSVRLKIPVHKHWNVIARGIFVVRDQPEGVDNNDLVLGGRVEFHGQTSVFLNLIRLYGGGGIQIFAPVTGSEKESFSGGGQFGFEFFFSSSYSFYIEIGGNGGSLGLSGATVVAGIQTYPF